MSTPIGNLLNTDHPDLSPRGSDAWNKEVFERAYYLQDGPFARVCNRLNNGFSVLVYLPGNCMLAAAAVARKHGSNSNLTWEELGRPTNTNQPIGAILGRFTELFDKILAPNRRGTRGVIFHNLDMLNDGRGGFYSSDAAKTALLYLTESTRFGVSLGLSERRAGELPLSIHQAFDEIEWLDDLPFRRFVTLIPLKLSVALHARAQELPDTDAWLIASRLRWSDPLRAVNIMETIASGASVSLKLADVLHKIKDATRTIEFLQPADIQDLDYVPNPDTPAGYEQETIDLLRQSVIRPFQQWIRAPQGNNEAELQQGLRRLPPGLILSGPPGTGKTRLARWIAKSIDLPIRLVSAADLKRADWGLTEQLVKELFRSARQAAPCVIVLDDADDLLPDRNTLQGTLSSAERGIVNAFLQELEGWRGRLEGILVILTTNRYAALDEAARQRLHLHIRIPYPLTQEQVEQIVVAVGRSYNLTLPDAVMNSLKAIFFEKLKSSGEDTADPNVRRALNNNLYSPREIAAAMRLLIGNGKVVTDDDVTRMQNYLAIKNRDATSQR